MKTRYLVTWTGEFLNNSGHTEAWMENIEAWFTNKKSVEKFLKNPRYKFTKVKFETFVRQ